MAVKGLNQLSHCRKDSLICWLLRKGSRNGWCRRRQVIRTDRGGLSVFSQSVPQEQPSVHAHGSIVLAAVPAQSLRSFSGGIRGRAITLSSSFAPVPVPNKQPRFCGRKAIWSSNAYQLTVTCVVYLHVCYLSEAVLEWEMSWPHWAVPAWPQWAVPARRQIALLCPELQQKLTEEDHPCFMTACGGLFCSLWLLLVAEVTFLWTATHLCSADERRGNGLARVTREVKIRVSPGMISFS